MTDGALRARRDDVLVGGRVVRGEDDAHLRLHALDRELLAVEEQLVAADLRAPQQVAARVHRRLGGTLRAPHSRELRLGLRAAAIVEELLVDVELDAVGAEPVGEPDREVLGHGRALRARGSRRPAARAARAARAIVESRRHQLVDSRAPRDVHLEQPELAKPRRLHRARRRRAGCRSPRRRGTDPGRRAAPRGACRRSGRSRRRSGPRRPRATDASDRLRFPWRLGPRRGDTRGSMAATDERDDPAFPVGAACRIDSRSPWRQIAEIPVGLDPEGIAVDVERRRAFVACSRSDFVSVVDLETHEVIARDRAPATSRSTSASTSRPAACSPPTRTPTR